MAEKDVRIRLSQDGAERVQSALRGVEGGLKGIAGCALKMGAAYFGTQGVISALKYSMEQASGAEAAAKKLSVAYGKNTAELLKFAGERQKLTKFDDDGTVAAMASIAAFTNQESAVKALTIAAQDLAEAKGMDLVSAAELLGKTFGTETNALKRSGVEVNAAAGTSERLHQITKGLADLYGGQATEAAKTFEGQMAQTKNATDDMAQSIGEALMPAIQGALPELQNMAEVWGEIFSGKGEAYEEFKSIAKVFMWVTNPVAMAAGKMKDFVFGADAGDQSLTELQETIKDLGGYIPTSVARLDSMQARLAKAGKLTSEDTDAFTALRAAMEKQGKAAEKSLAIEVTAKNEKHVATEKEIADAEAAKKAQRDMIKQADELAESYRISKLSIEEQIVAYNKLASEAPNILEKTKALIEADKLSIDLAKQKADSDAEKLKAFQEYNQAIADATVTQKADSDAEKLKAFQEYNQAIADATVTQEEFNAQQYEQIQQDALAVQQRDEWIQQNKDLAESLGMVTSSEQKAADAKQLLFEAQQAVAQTTSNSIGALAKANQALKGSAVVSKRLAQMQATVDTYASANAAFKSTAEIPIVGPALAPIAAAAAIVAGLANVAMIEQQQFASGGYVHGHGGGRSDMVAANLSAGEGVLTAATVARIGGEAAVNALNAGAGTGGGIVINFTGPVTDRAYVRDYIVPEVRRAVGRGMA